MDLHLTPPPPAADARSPVHHAQQQPPGTVELARANGPFLAAVGLVGSLLSAGVSYGTASGRLEAVDATAKRAVDAASQVQVLEERLQALQRSHTALEQSSRESTVTLQAHATRIASVEAEMRAIREGLADVRQGVREILSEVRTTQRGGR